jgi:hypothetical protein
LSEAQKINVSLLALGNVITTLAKRSDAERRAVGSSAAAAAASAAAPHVPFRDSQLTRLLQVRNRLLSTFQAPAFWDCLPPQQQLLLHPTCHFGNRS